MTHKFPYKWNLKDGYPSKDISDNKLKVFGTFICGGGSSMGYKLTGYNHLGGVEIDTPIAETYKKNHNPKYLYNMDIRDFVRKNDFPKELYELDILDGSPPCSTFSTAGLREEGWGKKKKFKEGQKHQRLDDLFFEFISLANKLKPKVIIAENVKGIIQGNAKAYINHINKSFNNGGYNTQLFLLNSASMGIPQKRERVFFICSRKDLKLPKLRLNFREKGIPFSEISDHTDKTQTLTDLYVKYWRNAKEGESVGRMKCCRKVSENKPIHTIDSTSNVYHNKYIRSLNDKEYSLCGSYPLDYNFNKIKARYLIGMSVPPVMMAQIAHKIYIQWFKKLI